MEEYNKNVFCASDNNYLREAIIAYIGNKRRLLPFLSRHIGSITEKDGKVKSAVDLFAGSGSVSRLLRTMNLKVYSNDIEYYSYILNYAHNHILPKDEKNMFKHFGGIENTLTILNNLPDTKDKYMSLYYAPQNDNNPDIENERMFYTQENARIIDNVRNAIEHMYVNKAINKKEYFYLLARLIYEAATHANTSGVFKAFHKGFGGKNHDALSRIMKKISMTKLHLYGDVRGEAYNMEAYDYIKTHGKHGFDLVYIDPPYNQHQYGSNYHMLTTIALWDKPSVNKDIYIDGKKTDKSAIRKDWIKTKSEYCYKEKADKALRKLIDAIDGRHILVSYSTDGIIEYDNFIDILSNRGNLSVVSEEYTRYPGGKRSIVNQTKNIEYLFIVNTKTKKIKNIEYQKIRMIENVRLMLSKSFNTDKDVIFFSDIESSLEIKLIYKTHVLNKEEICLFIKDKSVRFINSFYKYIKNFAVEESQHEIYLYMKNLEYYIDEKNTKAINYFMKHIKRIYVRFNSKKGKIYILGIDTDLKRILKEASKIAGVKSVKNIERHMFISKNASKSYSNV